MFLDRSTIPAPNSAKIECGDGGEVNLVEVLASIKFYLVTIRNARMKHSHHRA